MTTLAYWLDFGSTCACRSMVCIGALAAGHRVPVILQPLHRMPPPVEPGPSAADR
jgi:hypothetical protein